MEKKIFVQAPSLGSLKHHGVTNDKVYEAVSTGNDGVFIMVNDYGERIATSFKNSSVISYADWIVYKVVTHESVRDFNFKLPNENQVIHEAASISDRVYLAGQIANGYLSNGARQMNKDEALLFNELVVDITDELLKQLYAPVQS